MELESCWDTESYKFTQIHKMSSNNVHVLNIINVISRDSIWVSWLYLTFAYFNVVNLSLLVVPWIIGSWMISLNSSRSTGLKLIIHDLIIQGTTLIMTLVKIIYLDQNQLRHGIFFDRLRNEWKVSPGLAESLQSFWEKIPWRSWFWSR